MRNNEIIAGLRNSTYREIHQRPAFLAPPACEKQMLLCVMTNCQTSPILRLRTFLSYRREPQLSASAIPECPTQSHSGDAGNAVGLSTSNWKCGRA